MKLHRLVTAASLLTLMAAILPLSGCKTAPAATQAATEPATQAATAPAADTGTPDRMADGRVAQTIKENPDDADLALDQRVEKINAANKARNDWLATHPLPIGVAIRVPDGSIKVDGLLDEAAWKQAPVITDFKEMGTDNPVAAEQTRVRLLWDSKYLYVGVECDDTDIQAVAKDRDGEVWNDDAIEVFVNPSGDEMSYLQFDINPLGTWYDGVIADYRPDAMWKSAELDMEKSPKAFDTKDSKWAATVDGKVVAEAPSTPTKVWTAEMAIAWTDIARGTNVIHQVPQEGDVWRMNFGRINKSGSGDDANSIWSPTKGWFHCPWVFGRVVFLNGASTPADAATEPAK